MNTEYVTPPYSEEMKKVCSVLEKKIDNIVEVQVNNGVDEKEATENAVKYITQHITVGQ
jgi:hypothetical protein